MRPRTIRSILWTLAVGTGFALGLPGCAELAYYRQAAAGQWTLFQASRPVTAVLADPAISADLRQRLATAQALRAFASADLALPDNGSYRSYADLGRPWVVKNVFAAPELSLEPRRWCFPVAGCLSYRGYFEAGAAQGLAEELRAGGDDVYVADISAYSTLGWFDDPLLSSFIRYPDVELARLVFHELAHQLVYVPGDTMFNESFATAVEEAGLDRWIASRPPAEAAWLADERERSERQRAAFRSLIGDARHELAAVYASDLAEEAKREAKRSILAGLRAAWSRARSGEPALAGYDRWFAGDGGAGPNNASLASIGLYTALLPGFRALLAREDGDLPRFYARVREIAALPKDERHAALGAPVAGGMARRP